MNEEIYKQNEPSFLSSLKELSFSKWLLSSSRSSDLPQGIVTLSGAGRALCGLRIRRICLLVNAPQSPGAIFFAFLAKKMAPEESPPVYFRQVHPQPALKRPWAE
jgi:hypothetical protein